MDEQSKAMLAEITAKDLNDLTESDVTFLRARQSYLTADEAVKYAEFLQEAEDSSAEAKEEPKKKASK